MTTPQRQANEELQRERNLLRTLIDQLPVCTYVKDREGRFLAANLATACAMGAASPDELLGKTDADFYPPAITAEYREDERRIFETGQPLINKDEPHVDRSGMPRAVLTTKVPFRDGSGRIIGLVGVSQDVTERKLTEEALQQAKADAEKANQAKSRFLAYVSHDLRTPMSSILGMVDLALERTTDPTAKDFLQTARESADLLLALLNDLLDCARIESGKLDLEAAPFSLRRALDQTRKVLALRACEKGIAFSYWVPPEVPDALVGDQVRLRQILFNLAGNAIKFTERGEVAVSVRRVESPDARARESAAPSSLALDSRPSPLDSVVLEFAVRDTGIGIPQAELKRIFQPFTQAESSSSHRIEGTGLGLTICARLVAMMHGHIRVDSMLGQGSTFRFTVRLPLAQESPVRPEIPLDVLPPLTSTLRILLVEDNPAIRRLVACLLERRGHLVEIAGDGQQAVTMAHENHYDVILMDVQMPGMDGLESTAEIRARESGGRVPIVAMTACAMKSDRQRCLDAGMDGYLSKPINEREMILLLETLAAGSASPANAVAAASTLSAAESLAESARIFDLQKAIKLCAGRREAFRSMVQWFFGEADKLLPEMRLVLQRGNLVEVGRLAHRLKGTLIYLSAGKATDAAQRVERFVSGGSLGNAEEAVHTLEKECDALKSALSGHRPSNETGQERLDQEYDDR